MSNEKRSDELTLATEELNPVTEELLTPYGAIVQFVNNVVDLEVLAEKIIKSAHAKVPASLLPDEEVLEMKELLTKEEEEIILDPENDGFGAPAYVAHDHLANRVLSEKIGNSQLGPIKFGDTHTVSLKSLHAHFVSKQSSPTTHIDNTHVPGNGTGTGGDGSIHSAVIAQPTKPIVPAPITIPVVPAPITQPTVLPSNNHHITVPMPPTNNNTITNHNITNTITTIPIVPVVPPAIPVAPVVPPAIPAVPVVPANNNATITQPDNTNNNQPIKPFVFPTNNQIAVPTIPTIDKTITNSNITIPVVPVPPAVMPVVPSNLSTITQPSVPTDNQNKITIPTIEITAPTNDKSIVPPTITITNTNTNKLPIMPIAPIENNLPIKPITAPSDHIIVSPDDHTIVPTITQPISSITLPSFQEIDNPIITLEKAIAKQEEQLNELKEAERNLITEIEKYKQTIENGSKQAAALQQEYANLETARSKGHLAAIQTAITKLTNFNYTGLAKSAFGLLPSPPEENLTSTVVKQLSALKTKVQQDLDSANEIANNKMPDELSNKLLKILDSISGIEQNITRITNSYNSLNQQENMLTQELTDIRERISGILESINDDMLRLGKLTDDHKASVKNEKPATLLKPEPKKASIIQETTNSNDPVKQSDNGVKFSHEDLHEDPVINDPVDPQIMHSPAHPAAPDDDQNINLVENFSQIHSEVPHHVDPVIPNEGSNDYFKSFTDSIIQPVEPVAPVINSPVAIIDDPAKPLIPSISSLEPHTESTKIGNDIDAIPVQPETTVEDKNDSLHSTIISPAPDNVEIEKPSISSQSDDKKTVEEKIDIENHQENHVKPNTVSIDPIKTTTDSNDVTKPVKSYGFFNSISDMAKWALGYKKIETSEDKVSKPALPSTTTHPKENVVGHDTTINNTDEKNNSMSNSNIDLVTNFSLPPPHPEVPHVDPVVPNGDFLQSFTDSIKPVEPLEAPEAKIDHHDDKPNSADQKPTTLLKPIFDIAPKNAHNIPETGEKTGKGIDDPAEQSENDVKKSHEDSQVNPVIDDPVGPQIIHSPAPDDHSDNNNMISSDIDLVSNFSQIPEGSLKKDPVIDVDINEGSNDYFKSFTDSIMQPVDPLASPVKNPQPETTVEDKNDSLHSTIISPEAPKKDTTLSLESNDQNKVVSDPESENKPKDPQTEEPYSPFSDPIQLEEASALENAINQGVLQQQIDAQAFLGIKQLPGQKFRRKALEVLKNMNDNEIAFDKKHGYDTKYTEDRPKRLASAADEPRDLHEHPDRKNSKFDSPSDNDNPMSTEEFTFDKPTNFKFVGLNNNEGTHVNSEEISSNSISQINVKPSNHKKSSTKKIQPDSITVDSIEKALPNAFTMDLTKEFKNIKEDNPSPEINGRKRPSDYKLPPKKHHKIDTTGDITIEVEPKAAIAGVINSAIPVNPVDLLHDEKQIPQSKISEKHADRADAKMVDELTLEFKDNVTVPKDEDQKIESVEKKMTDEKIIPDSPLNHNDKGDGSDVPENHERQDNTYLGDPDYLGSFLQFPSEKIPEDQKTQVHSGDIKVDYVENFTKLFETVPEDPKQDDTHSGDNIDYGVNFTQSFETVLADPKIQDHTHSKGTDIDDLVKQSENDVKKSHEDSDPQIIRSPAPDDHSDNNNMISSDIDLFSNFSQIPEGSLEKDPVIDVDINKGSNDYLQSFTDSITKPVEPLDKAQTKITDTEALKEKYTTQLEKLDTHLESNDQNRVVSDPESENKPKDPQTEEPYSPFSDLIQLEEASALENVINQGVLQQQIDAQAFLGIKQLPGQKFRRKALDVLKNMNDNEIAFDKKHGYDTKYTEDRPKRLASAADEPRDLHEHPDRKKSKFDAPSDNDSPISTEEFTFDKPTNFKFVGLNNNEGTHVNSEEISSNSISQINVKPSNHKKSSTKKITVDSAKKALPKAFTMDLTKEFKIIKKDNPSPEINGRKRPSHYKLPSKKHHKIDKTGDITIEVEQKAAIAGVIDSAIPVNPVDLLHDEKQIPQSKISEKHADTADAKMVDELILEFKDNDTRPKDEDQKIESEIIPESPLNHNDKGDGSDVPEIQERQDNTYLGDPDYLGSFHQLPFEKIPEDQKTQDHSGDIKVDYVENFTQLFETVPADPKIQDDTHSDDNIDYVGSFAAPSSSEKVSEDPEMLNQQDETTTPDLLDSTENTKTTADIEPANLDLLSSFIEAHPVDVPQVNQETLDNANPDHHKNTFDIDYGMNFLQPSEDKTHGIDLVGEFLRPRSNDNLNIKDILLENSSIPGLENSLTQAGSSPSLMDTTPVASPVVSPVVITPHEPVQHVEQPV